MGEVRKRTTLGRRLAAVASSAAVAALSLVGLSSVANAAGLGNIDWTQDGNASITVHKHTQPAITGKEGDGSDVTSSLPADAKPMEGVKFKVTLVDQIDLTDSAQWDTLKSMTIADAKAKVTNPASPEYSEEIATGADGKATFENLKLGVYIVEETDASAAKVDGQPVSVGTKAAPWLMVVPMSVEKSAGVSEWLYDVHAFPKNQIDALSKTAKTPEELGLGSIVKWDIKAALPALAAGQTLEEFTLTDALDTRLQYAGVEDVTYGGTALDAGDYNVTGTTTVVFALTTDGLNKVSANPGQDLKFVLKTKVVSLGQGTIENDIEGWVKPSGETGYKVETPGEGPDKPKPYTLWGEYKALKIDNNTDAATLEGAEFAVYATKALAQANDPKDRISIDGATVITSDPDGLVHIKGLFVGDSTDKVTSRSYWVREIKAPNGYVLPAGDAAITEITVVPGLMTAPTVDAVGGMKIVNTPHSGGEGGTLPSLPLTGASGTALFMIAGLLLVGGGVALRMRARANNRG